MTADKPAAKFDLDSTLAELGQLGKYQITTILLATFPIIFAAFNSQDYIFSAGDSEYRCRVPECDSNASTVMMEWINNAVPNGDKCHRYKPVTRDVIVNTSVVTCPVELFYSNQTVPCNSYVYGVSNTIVYDFGLECNEWRRLLVGTLSNVGTLLVLPITGYISDRWGRRVAIVINAGNTAILGVIKSFSVNYEMYLLLTFLGTTLGAGALSSSYIMATEVVGPKWRSTAGCTMNAIHGLGQVILGLAAWGVPYWRTRLLVLFVPQLLIISYCWILSESIRWLLTKKRYEEAGEILKRAAKINGKTLSAQSLESLYNLREVKDEKVTNERDDHDKIPLLKQIVESRIMLKRMCIIPIWWITTTLVYYGLSINAVGLVGNMYLNYVLVAGVEIPGVYMAVIAGDRIGRNRTLIIAFATCAVCTYAFAFMPRKYVITSMFLYVFGKFAISAVLSTVYMYTSELIPTRHRHSLLGFSSMVGRIGSITAPMSPALMVYWSGLPSIIFGTMALISAALVINMPETLNTTLPDTIEEAEVVGRKQK